LAAKLLAQRGEPPQFSKKEGISMKKSTQQKIVAALALLMAVLMLLPIVANIFVH
jgi:hypothetical protein